MQAYKIPTVEAANDTAFSEPLKLAIGQQFPIPPEELKPGQKPTNYQKFYTRADHRECADADQLLAALTLKAHELPEEATDADREDGKHRAPFVILGGLSTGGSAERLTKEQKASADSKQFTRCNDTAAPAPVVAFDMDKLSPEAANAIFGNEFTGGGVIGDAGLMAIVYGSPRYTPEKPKIRCIVATSRPIQPEEKTEISLRAEQAIMTAAGATRGEGKTWSWTAANDESHVIEFDPAQYRRAQMLFCPPKNGMMFTHNGNWLDVDALPELDEEGQRQARGIKDSANDADYERPEALSRLAEWLLENGLAEEHSANTLNVQCPYHEEHSDDHTSGGGINNSCVLKLDADRTKERAACSHTGGELHEAWRASKTPQLDFFRALGVPDEILLPAFGGIASADDFEQLEPVRVKDADGVQLDAAPVVAIAGKAAFLSAGAGVAIVPFKQWNGNTGDAYRDEERAQLAKVAGVPLRFIPPRVLVTKRDKEGKPLAYNAIDHADNFKWACYRSDVLLTRNLMTFEVEVFNRLTNEQMTTSEAKTNSYLIGQASQFKLPKEIIKNHGDAVAEDYSYHPVERLLHGVKWDGVERVKRVIECVPVEADAAELRDALLLGLCAGALGSLDNGNVSMKYAPVLYSEANDWFKTSFFRRLFDVLPGAFKEGVSLDPTNKDSVRNGVFTWFGEFGELDGMTKKESAPLKTFLGKDCDVWRAEHKSFYHKKDRQTVYAGTVNKADFLKDETLSSRLPVISLSAPIAIDEVNEILGWELIAAQPVRTNPEALIQFWAEIRHMMKHEGLTHALNVSTVINMKVRNEAFIDKGSYYDVLRDTIATNYGDLGGLTGEFTASQATQAIKAPSGQARQVGKALMQLVKEGILTKRILRGIARYKAADTTETGDE
ncbi:hypothetical protein DOC35_19485 [Salmonella enterica subsp. enterica]|nr:hypothetical protein [Salmonella enterica subsp. enterica]